MEKNYYIFLEGDCINKLTHLLTKINEIHGCVCIISHWTNIERNKVRYAIFIHNSRHLTDFANRFCLIQLLNILPLE